ncbi:MAG: hypothetical protein WCI34_06445 [Actinomycetes bacterium]
MSEEKSLFRRVTRYVSSDVADPRENRLTEVLASTIEAVDGLGLHLAIMWLDTDPNDDLYGYAGEAEPRDIKLAESTS